jgi:hypothetical protein
MRADLALRRGKTALKLNAKGPDTPARDLRQYLGACARVLNPAEGRGRRHATHTLVRLASVWRRCGGRHLTWSNSSEILCGLPSLECQHVSGQLSNIFSLPYCLPVEELTWGVYHTCQHPLRRSCGDEP